MTAIKTEKCSQARSDKRKNEKQNVKERESESESFLEPFSAFVSRARKDRQK